MASSIVIVRDTTPTSAGTKDFTDAGIADPKAVIVLASRTTADDSVTDHYAHSVGWAIGSASDDEQCVVCDGEDAQESSDTHGSESGLDCLKLLDPTGGGASGTLEVLAQFSSWLSTGVRLNFSTVSSNAYKITLIFFCGTEVSVKAGSQTTGVQDDTVDITSPGFEPDLVLGIGTVSTGRHGQTLFGCCVNDGSATQRSVSFYSDDNEISSELTGYFSDTRLLVQANNGSLVQSVECGSFDSSGFSLTWRDSSTTFNMRWLAIQFSDRDVWLGTCTIPNTSPPFDFARTGVGFQPEFLLFGLSELATANFVDTSKQASVFGVGCCDSADAGGFGSFDKDGEATTVCKSTSDAKPINLKGSNGAGVEKHVKGVLKSFDSDGFTLTISNENFAHNWNIWGLAVGPAAAGGGDPEAGLVSGKLIRGGLLLGGALVR